MQRFFTFLFSNMSFTYDQIKQAALKKIEFKQALAAAVREREICAETSMGNISLQRGEYFTPEDTKALKEELVAYFLPNNQQ
jgi:hypothetical protein